MRALCIVSLFLLSFVPVGGRNDWMLKRDKDGMVIYSRRSDFAKFNDIRVEMDLPGTVEQLASIIRDVGKYTNWIYSTKSAVMVKKVSDNELIYYSEISTPWPAANRDFYADMKMFPNPANHSLNIVSVGLKDYLPEKKDLVRVPMSRGCWTVTTQPDKKIHLQYIIQIDPGGSVPAWILNSFATRAPAETFGNLKKMMEDLNR